MRPQPRNRGPQCFERRSAIRGAERLPGHLQGQNGTAAEHAEAADAIARAFEPEDKQFSRLDRMKFLSAWPPEIDFRHLRLGGQVVVPLIVCVCDKEGNHSDVLPRYLLAARACADHALS